MIQRPLAALAACHSTLGSRAKCVVGPSTGLPANLVQVRPRSVL